MTKAQITLVDIRDDGSVMVLYDSGSAKAYNSVDVLPKTAHTWLEAHPTQEPVTFVATNEGVEIQPVQLPAVATSAAPAPVQTSDAVTTDQDDCILLRWFLPTIPYMFLWWFVMYAWAGVTVIGKIVGLVEAVKPHIVEGIRFIRTWWKQSAGFRAELIQEYRLADWEVA